MEHEQQLSEQLKQQNKMHEQERQKWQHEKEEYQNLCTWYANSIRYRLGSLLIDTLRRPSRYLMLPIEIYRLFKAHKHQTSDRDIESSVPVSVEQNIQVREFEFSEIEKSVDKVRQERVTIIIPIYNAYEEACNCVESIINKTEFPYSILLVNDCSSDSRVIDLLELYSCHENVRVITNDQNLGYVKSVNKGIRACTGDVVLLNSDTIVTDRWLDKLVLAAYTDANIMTVTPVSNAAGAFSVPMENVNNSLDESWQLEDISKLVENQSSHYFERVPTGNGFCMYIKRIAFEEVGYFDDAVFEKGYCEENDFCMRLLLKGYENVVCDDTYIYHHHTASFGDEKQKLYNRNKKMLLDRYPQYDYLVGNMLKSENLKQLRVRIQQEIVEYAQNKLVKKNILYVIQSANGGTVKTNEDLMGYVSLHNWNVFLLNSDCNTLRLYQFIDGTLHLLQQWKMEKGWDINRHYDIQWRTLYFNVLYNCHIDIVHIRHLFKHTFDIVDVAKWMHIPVALSFHDFYYICPTINLINGKGVYCDADCTKPEGKCKISEPCINIDGKLCDWVENNWREKLVDVFNKVDAFITTSDYSKNLYERVFSCLKGRINIYEHGRDFAYPRKFYGSNPNGNEKIRILVAGNIDFNKGAKYLEQLLDADINNKLEFHCIGNISEGLKSRVKYYGKYLRDDFKDYVVKIKPSFVGVFSIWPETYCHVITESFSCGIPCVVSDIGTLRERGLKGGCILANLYSPSDTCEKIYEIGTHPEIYDKLQKEALQQTIRTVDEMGQDYLDLYDLLITRS